MLKYTKVSFCGLTTCCAVFGPGLTLLIEQDGSHQDDHLNHDGYERLQRLPEGDDLQQWRRKYSDILFNITSAKI